MLVLRMKNTCVPPAMGGSETFEKCTFALAPCIAPMSVNSSVRLSHVKS